ncbi:MAG: biotin--[acetyl-CoA-carboxylase] ligase [Deltaproteobacteria bacterium]|nr:biotin--[acetyl-CoA-carboxylase] ligase [Deltaproteobacteria bacterium]
MDRRVDLEAAIGERLESRTFGRALECHETLSSTNDRARRWLDEGGPTGLAVLALHQSSGRGRGRRKWASPSGAGLYVSFGSRVAPSAAHLLALAAGLATHRAVESLIAKSLELKWPNDLVTRERKKLAGVLIEASSLAGTVDAVIGIGLNLDPTGRPAELEGVATSLTELSPDSRIDLVSAFTKIAAHLEAELEALASPDGAARLRFEWSRRAFGLGRRARVTDGAEDVAGIFQGISEDGALVLSAATGPRRVYAGDLELLEP